MRSVLLHAERWASLPLPVEGGCFHSSFFGNNNLGEIITRSFVLMFWNIWKFLVHGLQNGGNHNFCNATNFNFVFSYAEPHGSFWSQNNLQLTMEHIW